MKSFYQKRSITKNQIVPTIAFTSKGNKIKLEAHKVMTKDVSKQCKIGMSAQTNSKKNPWAEKL
jgi:hypothetical protein